MWAFQCGDDMLISIAPGKLHFLAKFTYSLAYSKALLSPLPQDLRFKFRVQRRRLHCEFFQQNVFIPLNGSHCSPLMISFNICENSKAKQDKLNFLSIFFMSALLSLLVLMRENEPFSMWSFKSLFPPFNIRFKANTGTRTGMHNLWREK